MKIYRFVPNGRDYPSIAHSTVGQWWPDGINLGRFMGELHPKTYGNYPWPHKGNRFYQAAPEADLSDFPAFALNLPIVSPRAAETLVRVGLISEPVPITVSGKRCFAIQPLLSEVNPDLPDAFVAETSRGLLMPNGEVFLYYARVFDPAKIPGEFFMIPQFEPFSELYLTERLVNLARANGFTGLEYLELVFDDGPVEPRYPSVARTAIPTFTIRRELEWELLKGRCDLMAYDHATIEDAVDAAVCDGYIAFDYVQPVYRR